MEFGAVLILGIPLIFLLIYVAIEITHYFAIKAAMDSGSRAAARQLVVEYNKTGTQVSSINLGTWPTLKMPNYINNSSQYTVVWDSANNPPQYVDVQCSYDNSAGLPPFPSGPLSYFATSFNMKDSNGNVIVVTSSTRMPVQ